MDAAQLAHIVARLHGPYGFCHEPGEGCQECGWFWRQIADILTALEAEVRQQQARVVVLVQECTLAVPPATPYEP